MILFDLTDEGSFAAMRKSGSENRLKRFGALGALLLLTGVAVAGPTGLLAWSENAAALEVRESEIAELTAKLDAYLKAIDAPMATPNPEANNDAAEKPQQKRTKPK